MSGAGPVAPPDEAATAVAVDPALVVRGVSKTFGSTAALVDVDMTVGTGRVHGLLGGNGSGKSTLIKVLAGIHHGDPGGTIRLGTREVAADEISPALSLASGLRFVHQDPGVFASMTVAENLALGGGPGFPTRGGRVHWAALRRRARGLLERFEIEASPDDRLEHLRQAERTMVAIARALQDEGDDAGDDGRRVLVLDEPTASLPEHEVETLLQAVRRCAGHGHAVVYVSHRLEEVVGLVDDLTVLRDGRVVASRSAEGLTTGPLIEAIVGRSLAPDERAGREPATGDARLTVEGLRGGPLRDVSFDVRRGEIVGVAGLLGSGRTELLQMLFGALPRDGGTVRLDGAPCAPRRPSAAMRDGIAFVPEDRTRDAAFVDLTVAVNLSAAQTERYRRRGRLDMRAERRDAATSIEEFGVRAPGPTALLSALSGGNQQKVVLARWLRRDPRLLLLDEPTQGVDVGARADLYALIEQAAARSMATLVVSSDFEELAHVADRVLVLRDGRIAADVPRERVTAHHLTDLLYAEDPA